MKSSAQYATSGIQGYIRNTKTGQMLRFDFPKGVMMVPISAQIGEHHVEGQLCLSHIEAPADQQVDMQIVLKLPSRVSGVVATPDSIDDVNKRDAIDGLPIPNDARDARRGPNPNIQEGTGVDGLNVAPLVVTPPEAPATDLPVAPWPKGPDRAVESSSAFPTRPNRTLQADGSVSEDKKESTGTAKSAAPAEKKEEKKR